MAGKKSASGALKGVRVLDFGHYVPGPLLGMLLADQGADVIKVERPEGDPARRHPAFATWNRGKRSIVLNLKHEPDQQTAQELARTADVLIENFRPGVADTLGIGYEKLSELNPRLIYCSLPGFGEDSPHRDHRGWESIVGAATGVYQAPQGESEPLFVPLPVASTFAAIIGAGSVGVALVSRHGSGVGQRIEIPLHNAVFAAMGRHLVRLYDMEPEDLFTLPRNTMARQYLCADGRYVQNHGMFERFARQFLTVAGHPEWIEEFVAYIGKPVDPETVDMWKARFENLFLQRSSQEWENSISAAGGACAVCNTVDEWLEHEHAQAAGMIAEVEDSNFGNMKQPGVTIKLRGTPGEVQGRAPLLGEHTDEIVEELKKESARHQSMAANDAPDVALDAGPRDEPRAAAHKSEVVGALRGIRVLDLCIILAGPTCGRTLGEFGADVIKIDDPARPVDIPGSLDVNRGKRSILLDLKSERGREVFWRLVDTADVIVENNRKGSLARLGLGYDDVKRRKPDIIYASLNAYGYDGPWSERPGWEQLAQAVSGIQVRRGGRDRAPITFHYPVNDYGTGLLGAYAVALALHQRDQTGKGQSVDGGLTLTACLLQSPFFLDYEGYQRSEPEGLGARGFSALSRLYAASDGWFYLHCTEEEWWKLVGVNEFSGLAYDDRFASPSARDTHNTELEEELQGIFLAKTRQHWITRLVSASLSAVENMTIPQFRDDPTLRRAGLISTREHPGRGRADHLGTTVRLSSTPVRLGCPSPMLGADTVEILREANYTEGEIDALKSERVVVQTQG